MYRVYLNGVLQDENDVIGISEGAEFTIIREFGIGNAEQILRDKTDVQLKFAGAAYEVFCNARRDNYCTNIDIRVDFYCSPTWETIFKGIIQQKNVELNFNKYIANVTAIRDNSFSGLVRDYLNTDIGLYNTKTISCDELSVISQDYILSSDPTNIAGSEVNVIGFDVLDVLQYYLNYITDNQIEIRSDYLTGTAVGDVRFAITTGYNMHNTTGTLEQTHPMLSFQKVFDELRKKLKIYMGIEYDEDNVPYLRIERESYFFDETEMLLNITETPAEIIEKLDQSLFYNQINVGSSTYELQTGSTEDYPQEKLIAWNEEQYTNCGGCGGEKDSILDLVSDFIIDSNVIYEALQEAPASDYANDDAVFMFHYYIDVATGQRYALITNDDVYGKDIYNEEITNELVLDKWSATSCAATYRQPENAFRVTKSGVGVSIVSIAPGASVNTYTQQNLPGDIIYDNKANLTTAVVSGTNPYGLYIPSLGATNNTTTYFTAPANGNYKFKASALFRDVTNPVPIVTLNGTNDSISFIVRLSVYSDNTFATLLQDIEEEVFTTFSFSGQYITSQTVEVNTDDVLLTSGNVVLMKLMVHVDGTASGDATEFTIAAYNANFELVDDSANCQDVEQSTSALPYVLELKYPICYGDFKNMKENKRGYIMVNDQRYWIREIKYRPGKLSDLVLLGSVSQCSATR